MVANVIRKLLLRISFQYYIVYCILSIAKCGYKYGSIYSVYVRLFSNI